MVEVQENVLANVSALSTTFRASLTLELTLCQQQLGPVTTSFDILIARTFYISVDCVSPPQACVSPPQACVSPPQACVSPPQACVFPPQACVSPPQACVFPPQLFPPRQVLWRPRCV